MNGSKNPQHKWRFHHPSMAPTVQGTPLPVGVQVIGDYDGELDPYPRIDVQTANVLQRARAFAIVQRPSLTEAACPSCERSNIYDIYDGNSGQHIFFAKERSECGWRFCCAPYHALFLDFKLSTGIPPQMYFMTDLDVLPTHMTMEREGCRCPGCRCPGCCTCSPEYCSDGMFLHAGPLRPGLDPGYLGATVPAAWALRRSRGLVAASHRRSTSWNEPRRTRTRAPTWNALAKVRPLRRLLELCCSSRFSVSSLSAQTLDVGLHKSATSPRSSSEPRTCSATCASSRPTRTSAATDLSPRAPRAAAEGDHPRLAPPRRLYVL